MALSEDEGARIIGHALAEMLDDVNEDYGRALGRHAWHALLPHLNGNKQGQLLDRKATEKLIDMQAKIERLEADLVYTQDCLTSARQLLDGDQSL